MSLKTGYLIYKFQISGTAELVQPCQYIAYGGGVCLVHGFQEYAFKVDSFVQRFVQNSAYRREIFHQTTQNLGVGQLSQFAAAGEFFVVKLQHRTGVVQYVHKLHATDHFQYIIEERFQISAPSGKLIDDGHHRTGLVLQHCRNQSIQLHSVGQAKEFQHLFGSDLLIFAAEKRQHLFQRGLSVTHTAFGSPGNGTQGFGGDLDIFAFGNHFKSAENQIPGNGPQIEPLTAGYDGRQYQVCFGGGKDEFYMCRRLFNGFQKSVPRCFGEHVDFVDNVNFILAGNRHVVGFFAQGTHVFHTVAAGGVDFYNIQIAFFSKGFTGLAFAAGFAIVGIFAVDGFGKNTGNGGFTDPPGPHQQIGVTHPVARYCITQSADNMGLTYYIAKFLRTPLAGDHLMTCHVYLPFLILCRNWQGSPAGQQRSL